MATNVTYAGNVYSVPAYQDTGYAQGSGNLSSYLIALATGSLTLSGGTFTLISDANFGATYGLIAVYYKSVTANIASAGVVRLAKTDTIKWRDNANGSDLSLGINTSDQLTFAGDILLPTGKGIVTTTPDGTKTYRIYVDDNGELTTLQLT